RKVGTSTKCSPGTKTKPTAKAQRTAADRAARANRWLGDAVATSTTAGEGDAPKMARDAGRWGTVILPFVGLPAPALLALRGRRGGDALPPRTSWGAGCCRGGAGAWRPGGRPG